MSTDSSFDLDSRISEIVERTVGKMRDELMARVEETESRLREIHQTLAGEVPAAPAPEPLPAAAEEAAPDRLPALFEAVVEIDRCRSQQEVLAALLEAAGRFANRTAVLLTRSDGAQGWGSYGFEEFADGMQEVRLDYGESGPLATLAEGSGCVPLDAGECAELCRQLGARPAAEGLLMPFVLRDRVAAVLYADRAADDRPLARRPLQLLSYIAAQAVEGLALRERDDTPTLRIASAEAAPGLGLWEEAAAPAEPVAEPEEIPVAETQEIAVAEPEEISAAETQEIAVAEPEEIAVAEPEEVVAVDEAVVAEEAMLEEPQELAAEPGMTLEDVAEPLTEPELGMPGEPADATLAAPAVEEPPVVEAPAEPAPPVEAEPGIGATDAGFQGVTVEPPPAPVEPPPPAPEAPADSTAFPGPAGDSTQVLPPSDISGPGWAFTASRGSAETGDEAQHEEARRLARLLVTEIKLYNEEQVEEGRRNHDIYGRLKEDIDRSRQIFNERVDEQIRQETDYFHEEMVRILAGGNSEALGV